MDDEAIEDLIAELASLNTLAMTALQAIAKTQTDPKAFLAKVLEDGSAAMEKTNYYSLPKERRAIVAEKAKARFADAITSIRL
ncbi:hypothetical protein [Neorhizobium sp. S3-V5DH]|uniref:hypothetical protein n=1 Tax=Neorhizobium sp. S3-V5DH TaxID=2485166 RepID=UPI001053187B|nr:hypothetical protein [Neorhizobium sp. S3-V5DH]TCV66295.1 hypothetical protein EDE09_11645 [Neorhizobium sp. S3-V5DH]